MKVFDIVEDEYYLILLSRRLRPSAVDGLNLIAAYKTAISTAEKSLILFIFISKTRTGVLMN